MDNIRRAVPEPEPGKESNRCLSCPSVKSLLLEIVLGFCNKILPFFAVYHWRSKINAIYTFMGLGFYQLNNMILCQCELFNPQFDQNCFSQVRPFRSYTPIPAINKESEVQHCTSTLLVIPLIETSFTLPTIQENTVGMRNTELNAVQSRNRTPCTKRQ